MKKVLAFIISISLIFSLVSVIYSEQSGISTKNINNHYYVTPLSSSLQYNFPSPIKSALVPNDGGYERVENCGGEIYIEQYDKDFNFVSGKTLSLELPIYGGVYMCDDYNFVICGQENYGESDSLEVIRVIRYTKEWDRVDSAGLFGANTTVPFHAGSLRCARSGDMLYVRTCHQMYASDDDCVYHQANLTFSVRISDMTVTDECSGVWNKDFGYASHSFNQFIRTDGSDLLAVDHGDAYPRSVLLTKYNAPAEQETFTGRVSYVEVFPISGSSGDNYTGVSVLGFECSDTHYIVAGSSIDQTEFEEASLLYNRAHRNIFVTSTDKTVFSSEGTSIRWLTDYTADDGVDVSPPHLVKLSGERLLLLWTENGNVCYAFLSGNGELDGEIYRTAGTALSDCVPAVNGNHVVWYVTDNSTPVFYQIDLDQPDKISASVTLGDTDSSGTVNVLDAITIVKYISGWFNGMDPLPINLAAADVNSDGAVNVLDAIHITKQVVGY